MLALLGLLAASVATAGEIQISPLRVGLSAKVRTAVLKVHNAGTAASVMQLSVKAWSQADGKEIFVPTQEVLVTPPIFTVAPGATQIARVALRRAPDARREIAYRLFLEEVPTSVAQEITMALRFTIPVFVAPLGKPPAPSLTWRMAAEPKGAWRIEASNRGSAHIQVTSFAVASADGTVLARNQRMDYLLPDQNRVWTLTPSLSAFPFADYSIVAQTDAGELRVQVPLER